MSEEYNGMHPNVNTEVWDPSRLSPEDAAWEAMQMALARQQRKLPPDATPLARELMRRMLEAGHSQKSLAITAGVGEGYVRDIFRGKSKNPKSQQLFKLAQALGCKTSDLTDPGRSLLDKQPGEAANLLSEQAVLEMWRTLNHRGKERFVEELGKILRSPAGEPAAPASRKTDDV